MKVTNQIPSRVKFKIIFLMKKIHVIFFFLQNHIMISVDVILSFEWVDNIIR